MTRYVEDTYAKIAHAYADQCFNDSSDHAIVEELARRLRPSASVLDLGCGPGQLARYLWGLGFSVEGIDNSEGMLTIARQKVPEVRLHGMDIRDLDYPDGH